MSASNKSLWQLFYSTHSSVITADLIDRELSHAPQSARRGVAWMHNAFYALIIDKFGSTDGFLTHLLNKAGPNKRGFTFVSKQMEQCAEIAALLQPDCDAAAKSLPPDMLMMRLFDRMKDWWIIDNTESMYSRVLMHFMSSAGYVALDCTRDPIQKIESDKKLDRTIGLTFIAASQLHLMLRSSEVSLD